MSRSNSFSPDTVALMRGSIEDLSVDPANASRLALRLLAAVHRVHLHLAPALGLSKIDLAAMLLLWDTGRMTMTDLGEQVRLSRATITTLVDRCEIDGWVQRMPDPHDRRRVLVSVTRKFDDAVLEAAEHVSRALQLDDDERRQALVPTTNAFRSQGREAVEALEAVALESTGRSARRERAADLEDTW